MARIESFGSDIPVAPIRQVVVGTAILLFAPAATQFWVLARRAERAFFRWYGFGLKLIAVGLVGVYFQTAVGTPLNWVGRTAQYLGGVYVLVALLTALQDRGLPLGKALALFFGEAETDYRPLVEAARDAVLSLDGAGRLRSILSLVLDVTERKRAEEALESVAEFPSENPNFVRASRGTAPCCMQIEGAPPCSSYGNARWGNASPSPGLRGRRLPTRLGRCKRSR